MLRLARRLALFSRHMHFSSRANWPKLPQFNDSAEQISSKAKTAINQGTQLLDSIASQSNNGLQTYASFEDLMADTQAVLSFYQYVSPEETLRKASAEAEQLLGDFQIEAGKRVDVYQQLKQHVESKSESTKVASRFGAKVIADFERAGLSLPEDKRKELTKLEKELSSCCIAYQSNLSGDNTTQEFTKSELEGVPASILSQLEKGDKYAVSYKVTDLEPVLKYCKVEETRKKLYVGSENAVPENKPLFEKALKLRKQIASLLGYKTHAHYVLEDRMAKSPDQVEPFLRDLVTKAKRLGQKEAEVLLKIKKEVDPSATRVYAWDAGYLRNILIERDFQVDQAKIAEYFPLDQTVKGMFSIFERVFGLEFCEMPLAHENKWHEDVTCFAILQDKSFKGYLYLDMYPRPNKYGHFANFGLIAGHIDANNETTYPVSALVCNFPKPSEEKPSLLYHRDVVTLFHELGHGIHSTLGLTKYSRFSGTNVARDFVETPSQLLENWTWDPKQLKDLGKHYKTKEPMPDSLIAALVKTKDALPATFLLRQLFFGIFDLEAHTSDNFDAELRWNQLRSDITGIECPETLNGYNKFGHLMGGYDCGYYGYLWALVYAADLWESLFAANPVSLEAGKSYRDTILARGSSVDESQQLREILNREPNSDAFLKEIGLAV